MSYDLQVPKDTIRVRREGEGMYMYTHVRVQYLSFIVVSCILNMCKCTCIYKYYTNILHVSSASYAPVFGCATLT